MGRRFSKKNLKWRVPTCTPEQLPIRYKYHLDYFVAMATGERFIWDSVTNNYYSSLCRNLKIKGWGQKVNEVRDMLLNLRSISKEDVYQEALISLLDCYHKYIAKMRRCTFTVYLLIHVPRYLAKVISENIKIEKGDSYCPTFSEEYWMDEPERLSINLAWVTLKEKGGVFSTLTTFQKYLLYLRYNKGMTVKEISGLTGRNLKLLELDFGYINKLLSPNAIDQTE